MRVLPVCRGEVRRRRRQAATRAPGAHGGHAHPWSDAYRRQAKGGVETLRLPFFFFFFLPCRRPDPGALYARRPYYNHSKDQISSTLVQGPRSSARYAM